MPSQKSSPNYSSPPRLPQLPQILQVPVVRPSNARRHKPMNVPRRMNDDRHQRVQILQHPRRADRLEKLMRNFARRCQKLTLPKCGDVLVILRTELPTRVSEYFRPKPCLVARATRCNRSSSRSAMRKESSPPVVGAKNHPVATQSRPSCLARRRRIGKRTDRAIRTRRSSGFYCLLRVNFEIVSVDVRLVHELTVLQRASIPTNPKAQPRATDVE